MFGDLDNVFVLPLDVGDSELFEDKVEEEGELIRPDGKFAQKLDDKFTALHVGDLSSYEPEPAPDEEDKVEVGDDEELKVPDQELDFLRHTDRGGGFSASHSSARLSAF